jgi:hypothetical protein
MLIQKMKHSSNSGSVTNAAFPARDTLNRSATLCKKISCKGPEFKKQLDNMVKMVEVKRCIASCKADVSWYS